MAVHSLLDLLAGLVGGRVEERAEGLDTLRHFRSHGANLPRLLFRRRSRLSAGLRVGSLGGAVRMQIEINDGTRNAV